MTPGAGAAAEVAFPKARPISPSRERSLKASERIRDISGLRGLALTLVVVFHLFGQGRVSGGVDVFLVVSGFLLTVSLGRAIGQGRGLGIVARWGRTFARLAPPALLVLLVIVVLVMTLFSVRDRAQSLAEVVASALYVENWQLISSNLAYGAAGPQASLMQHFWSLSVQAQFFLLFPLCAGVVVLVFRDRRVRQRVFWGFLLSGTVASFLFATWLNHVDPDAAYFHTAARFWELGIGGLAAGLFLRGSGLPRSIRPMAGWVGVIGIVASGFLLDGGSAYPGPLALIPVGGALLVLLSAGSSAPRGSASLVLGSRPLVALDGISYSLYLWHWPLLVVWLTVTEQAASDVGLLDASAVLTASVAAAWVTSRALGRLSSWSVSGQTVRSIVTVAVAIVLTIVPAGVLAVVSAPSAQAVSAIELNECQGASAMGPRSDCANRPESTGSLLPELKDLSVDNDIREECWGVKPSDPFRWCTLGPEEDYDQHFLVLGDSHAGSLTGMFEEVAQDNGWRIDMSTRGGCAWSMAVRPSREELKRACDQWRDEATALLNGDEMKDLNALIVTQSSTNNYSITDPAQLAERLGVRNSERWAMRENDIPVIAINDNPIFGRERNACIDDVDSVRAGECVRSRAEAVRPDGLDEAVALDGNARSIDLRDHVCDEHDVCHMVVGDVIVTRDGAHLTGTFAKSLAPYFEEGLRRALGLPKR